MKTMSSVIAFRTFIVALSILSSNVHCYSECPNVCTCKWKNGKQTAECSGKGLTVIPSDLNAATQVIDISKNSFAEIPKKSFHQKGLVNLQKIFLSECGITEIASDAFFQLRNLIELDLSGNKLLTVPTAALQDCPNLRRLQLAHNPINQVGGRAFAPLSRLTNLGLSNCNIKHVQPGALDGLDNLESIELDGNQLTTLSIDVFKPLTEMHELNLHNNPWYCDCKIQEIRLWMIERKIPLSIPPYCEGPVIVKDMSWKAMSLDDFACPPVMVHVPKETTVVVGHNASILCQVDATPKALIHWEVSGRSLKNISVSPELRAKYNVENEDSTRQSSILTVYNAQESDTDSYVCVAENKAGISSTNFSLLAVCPSHLKGSWSSTSITLLLVGILCVILLASAAICFLVHHPISPSFGSKISRNSVLHHLSSKKQDAVEMNDIGEDKEEKDLKTTDKQPRHETGSSGYGSDQLTPDLVSKIADMNNGPSLSTSMVSCNHLDADRPPLIDGYGATIDQWPLGKGKPPRYDGSPDRNVASEIYLNPCYGKDEDPYNSTFQPGGMYQISGCSADRYVPQNNRVQTLRAKYSCRDWNLGESQEETAKRYPLVVANSEGHFSLPAKIRFSPDEGYAEEGLEGTEV